MAESPYRTLVAGAGIAGCELLVALRKLAGGRVALEVLDPDDYLVYRPLLVTEPFGAGSGHRFPLADILADHDARRHVGMLAGVDVEAHEAVTAEGERLPYDALVIATGARPVEAVPGALCFASGEAVEPFRKLLARIDSRELSAIAFTLSTSAASWPLPLYELAFLTAARGGARVVIATAEKAPLELFGDAVSHELRARLEQAGIELHTAAPPLSFENGELRLAGGESIAADAAVALPHLEGPRIDGVPSDDAGFVLVDEHLRVPGADGVHAAGDAVSFPVKQGGVSVRQAQAAAECVAQRAGAPVTPEPFAGVLRDLLITGGEPSYLESGVGHSLVTDSPLWWPPAKIADSYLVPYLVSRFQLTVQAYPSGEEGDLVSSVPSGEPVPARPERPF
jgi:sulfide:quinone oxidoreductase